MPSLFMDCFSGASGDMIVGALIDAGADFDAVRAGLLSLGVSGFDVSADKVDKHGIRATQFRVLEEEHHHHPHRHLRHVLEIIDKGDLPDTVKADSGAVFTRIAECEAAVHGTTPEKVHFHEVGAVDSIVDIVGAHLARHLLGVDDVVSSPLAVGSGTVKCAHGVMPVPAPATALLLEGIPSYAGEADGELTTPTGAALVSHWAREYGVMPMMKVAAVGYGSGTRDLPDRANVLRVFLGEFVEALAATEPIVVVECNVDDMTPELLAPLLGDFLGAGARDVFLTPILGKKGRPAYLITVLCDEEKLSDIAAVFFRSSTTLGVRIRHERRICLERTWEDVETAWGPVRVKAGRFGDETCRYAPEFDDCQAVAARASVSVLRVYQEALAAALLKDKK
ncbi:MAG TPA: nickel pincer cofactor biosynthesis protein LarC [Candidatus Hydrogenedentes bacterium]|nr:nickel pincer cofactor biosynthesis protein LarC [Candidatus Hydrogenedentota bacterium]